MYEAIANLIFACTFRHWTTRNLIIWTFVSAPAVIVSLVVFGNGDTGWAWSNCLGGFARAAFGFPLGVLISRLRQRGHLDHPVPPLLPLAAGLACFLVGPRNGNLGLLLTATTLVGALPVVDLLAVQAKPSGRSGSACALLGTLSYPVYVLHTPMLWLSLALGFVDTAHPSPARVVLVAAAVVAGSLVAHRWYDLPVRAWLLRMSRPPAMGEMRPNPG